MSSKNYWLLRLLASSRTPLLYRGRYEASAASSLRWTSTTSTSKGQAISLANLNNSTPATTEANNRRKIDLSFEDSETAFKSKSNLQLLRGYLVFQLCSINFLVENQKTVS